MTEKEAGEAFYAIVEQNGHRRFGARVQNTLIAGVPMLGCEVLADPPFTTVVAPGSLFALTPCSESAARAANRHGWRPTEMIEAARQLSAGEPQDGDPLDGYRDPDVRRASDEDEDEDDWDDDDDDDPEDDDEEEALAPHAEDVVPEVEVCGTDELPTSFEYITLDVDDTHAHNKGREGDGPVELQIRAVDGVGEAGCDYEAVILSGDRIMAFAVDKAQESPAGGRERLATRMLALGDEIAAWIGVKVVEEDRPCPACGAGATDSCRPDCDADPPAHERERDTLRASMLEVYDFAVLVVPPKGRDGEVDTGNAYPGLVYAWEGDALAQRLSDEGLMDCAIQGVDLMLPGTGVLPPGIWTWRGDFRNAWGMWERAPDELALAVLRGERVRWGSERGHEEKTVVSMRADEEHDDVSLGRVDPLGEPKIRDRAFEAAERAIVVRHTTGTAPERWGIFLGRSEQTLTRLDRGPFSERWRAEEVALEEREELASIFRTFAEFNASKAEKAIRGALAYHDDLTGHPAGPVAEIPTDQDTQILTVIIPVLADAIGIARGRALYEKAKTVSGQRSQNLRVPPGPVIMRQVKDGKEIAHFTADEWEAELRFLAANLGHEPTPDELRALGYVPCGIEKIMEVGHGDVLRVAKPDGWEPGGADPVLDAGLVGFAPEGKIVDGKPVITGVAIVPAGKQADPSATGQRWPDNLFTRDIAEVPEERLNPAGILAGRRLSDGAALVEAGHELERALDRVEKIGDRIDAGVPPRPQDDAAIRDLGTAYANFLDGVDRSQSEHLDGIAWEGPGRPAPDAPRLMVGTDFAMPDGDVGVLAEVEDGKVKSVRCSNPLCKKPPHVGPHDYGTREDAEQVRIAGLDAPTFHEHTLPEEIRRTCRAAPLHGGGNHVIGSVWIRPADGGGSETVAAIEITDPRAAAELFRDQGPISMSARVVSKDDVGHTTDLASALREAGITPRGEPRSSTEPRPGFEAVCLSCAPRSAVSIVGNEDLADRTCAWCASEAVPTRMIPKRPRVDPTAQVTGPIAVDAMLEAEARGAASTPTVVGREILPQPLSGMPVMTLVAGDERAAMAGLGAMVGASGQDAEEIGRHLAASAEEFDPYAGEGTETAAKRLEAARLAGSPCVCTGCGTGLPSEQARCPMCGDAGRGAAIPIEAALKSLS